VYGPNFASVAKKILLSTTAFVLWKSAILCAFPGTFGRVFSFFQGNALAGISVSMSDTGDVSTVIFRDLSFCYAMIPANLVSAHVYVVSQ
jgi:hypothetical protein